MGSTSVMLQELETLPHFNMNLVNNKGTTVFILSNTSHNCFHNHSTLEAGNSNINVTEPTKHSPK